jgi:THO complex subunit 2
MDVDLPPRPDTRLPPIPQVPGRNLPPTLSRTSSSSSLPINPVTRAIPLAENVGSPLSQPPSLLPNALQSQAEPRMPPPVVPSQTTSAHELREAAKASLTPSRMADKDDILSSREDRSRPSSPPSRRRSLSPPSQSRTRSHSADSRASAGRSRGETDWPDEKRSSQRESRGGELRDQNGSRRDAGASSRSERVDGDRRSKRGRSRDRERRSDRGHRDKDRERGERSGREKDREGGDRERSERDRERDKDKERDKDRTREREREHGTDRHRRDEKTRERKDRETPSRSSSMAAPLSSVPAEDRPLSVRSGRRLSPDDGAGSKRRRSREDDVSEFRLRPFLLAFADHDLSFKSPRGGKRRGHREDRRDEPVRRTSEREDRSRGEYDRHRKERDVPEADARPGLATESVGYIPYTNSLHSSLIILPCLYRLPNAVCLLGPVRPSNRRRTHHLGPARLLCQR